MEIKQRLLQRQSISLKVQDSFMQKIPRGLSNIGNTCFLNSILQQLYMIEPVRKMVDDQKYNNDYLIEYLRTIFKQMKSSSEYDRSQNMRAAYMELIRYLEKVLPNYKLNTQYDSQQTFLELLDHLIQQNDQLLCQFQTKFFQKCGCAEIRTSCLTLDSIDGKCFTCKQHLSRIFTTYPNYLIVRGQELDSLKEKFKKDRQFYIIQSYNMYNGNGNSGHYYTLSNYKKKLYVCNDNSVLESSQIKWSCSKPPFTIFKKVSKESFAQQDLKLIIQVDRPNQKEDQNSSKLSKMEDCLIKIPMGIWRLLILILVCLKDLCGWIYEAFTTPRKENI